MNKIKKSYTKLWGEHLNNPPKEPKTLKGWIKLEKVRLSAIDKFLMDTTPYYKNHPEEFLVQAIRNAIHDYFTQESKEVDTEIINEHVQAIKKMLLKK